MTHQTWVGMRVSPKKDFDPDPCCGEYRGLGHGHYIHIFSRRTDNHNFPWFFLLLVSPGIVWVCLKIGYPQLLRVMKFLMFNGHWMGIHHIKSYTLWLFNSSPWKIHPVLRTVKPSISMGHLDHGYVSHNQRVNHLMVGMDQSASFT